MKAMILRKGHIKIYYTNKLVDEVTYNILFEAFDNRNIVTRTYNEDDYFIILNKLPIIFNTYNEVLNILRQY